MGKPVPSLSAAGWLQSIAEKGDSLMANYLTSDYSQTHVYKDKVTSLAYHIQQYGHNADLLEKRMKSDLTTYFTRYFDKVDVTVSTTTPSELEPNRLNLTIDVNFYQDGQQYNLGKQIETVSNKVVKVFDIINNG